MQINNISIFLNKVINGSFNQQATLGMFEDLEFTNVWRLRKKTLIR